MAEAQAATTKPGRKKLSEWAKLIGTLSRQRQPRFETVLELLNTLGYRLAVGKMAEAG